QKKTKVSQPIEEDSKAKSGPTTQGKKTPTPEIIDQKDESEKDPKDLDKKIAKDMFKVDGAEYAFSTWFAEIEFKKYKAEITEEWKMHQGGPNVILTKKMKPEFWVEIDKKFLVREVSGQSEVERLDSNA
ncbi:18322_t:CDS:2, partial [Racocetra persica]